MPVERRMVLAGAAALGVTGIGSKALGETANMFGLIGKMLAKPGGRDTLIAALTEGSAAMPGCLSYIVAADPTNPDAIWVTEVWTDRTSHEASLRLPSVQAAIAKARPVIAGFGERFETEPVWGSNLPGIISDNIS